MEILEPIIVERNHSRRRAELGRISRWRKSARVLQVTRVDDQSSEQKMSLRILPRPWHPDLSIIDQLVDDEKRREHLFQVGSRNLESVGALQSYRRRGIDYPRILNGHCSGWRHA